MAQTLAVLGMGTSLFAAALVISEAVVSFYSRRAKVRERLSEIANS